MTPTTARGIETVPLTDRDREILSGQLFTRGRFARDLAMLPLGLFAGVALCGLPVGLLVLLVAGLDYLLGTSLLQHRVTGLLFLALWVALTLVAFAYSMRHSVAEYRSRFAANAPLKADLASGVKHCEALRIEEALCVQENEHSGLGYFCRVADGRVIFVIDYASASWEDEDLAEGYRRGVDPRQERFVPTDTLRLCQAAASGYVFEEDFSGAPVPRVEGIYWTDVTRLPDSGTFIDQPWEKVRSTCAQAEKRVDWTEVIERAVRSAASN